MTDPSQSDTGTFFATNLSGSAGATLRAAREKTGMRLNEMAVKTKIPLHVLEAIEHDDTAKLGQPVYVRGYLRKYAAALGVAESQVLTSFDARAMAPPKEASRLANEHVEEPAAGSRAIIWVLVVVILAAIAGAAVMYIRGWGPSAIQQRKAAPARSEPQAVAPAPAPVETAPAPAAEIAPPPDTAAPAEAQTLAPAEESSAQPAAEQQQPAPQAPQ